MAYRPQAGRSKPVRKRSRAAPLVGIGMVGLLVGGVAGWAAANVLTDSPPDVETVTTSSTPDTTTTSEPATSTTVQSPPTTIGGAVGAGGGVFQDGQRAWIVGLDGIVVGFVPDPNAADARAVEAPVAPENNTTAFAWRSSWSIEDGRLHRDGQRYELGLVPELGFAGLESENGLIWLLSDDGTWLVAFEPESTCVVLPVDADGTATGRDPDVTVPECAPAHDEGE